MNIRTTMAAIAIAMNVAAPYAVASSIFEWEVITGDAATKRPLAGVTVNFDLKDISSGQVTQASCTTNETGECSVSGEAEGGGFLSFSTARMEATFTVSKEGYKKSFKTSKKQIKPGKLQLILILEPAIRSQFVVNRPDGSPVDGAQITSSIKTIGCITDATGVCKAEHDEPMQQVQVIKPGYLAINIDGVVSGGQRYVTLRTEQEATEFERQKKENQIESERRRDEEARALAAERRQERHRQIKEIGDDFICAAYGNVIRGESQGYLEVLIADEDAEKVKEEFARRKLSIKNKNLVREKEIRIAMSVCEMYASWGYPKKNNRSVGRWGEHIQHIYGNGTYVYSENGRITSWQD